MVERFRLLFGHYVTPRVRLGEALAELNLVSPRVEYHSIDEFF